MGLFGKLFEKKECAICGGEIGLLGNRKLEDGNMCKNCAKLLSPWFSERRKSTVEQIKEQLAYREENRKKVSAFHITRTFGEYTKVLLDEDAGVFMVTSARNLEEANPDVLSFSDVTGCNLDVDESRSEVMREDNDGKKVSYHPTRYIYRYNFRMTIHVSNPYFDEIQFALNNRSVEMESQEPQRMSNSGVGWLMNGAAMSIHPEYNVEYRHYQQMGDEIQEALMRVRQPVSSASTVPDHANMQQAGPWFCPSCGAQNKGSVNPAEHRVRKKYPG